MNFAHKFLSVSLGVLHTLLDFGGGVTGFCPKLGTKSGQAGDLEIV